MEDREKLFKVAVILSALVGLESRDMFAGSLPPDLKLKVIGSFGEEVDEAVILALREAQHVMHEADKVGKIYVAEANIKSSVYKNRVWTDNSLTTLMSFPEVALNRVLAQLGGREAITPMDFEHFEILNTIR